MFRLSSALVLVLIISLFAAVYSASCLNDCSQHGFCSSAGTCLCDESYLAIDCSVQSAMKPMVFLGGNYTTYWSISNDIFYHRIIARTGGSGWAGVLFDAVDFMTGGRGHVVTVPNAFNGTVYDVYATGKHKPISVSSIVLNAVGFSERNHIDVSYSRPTATSDEHHYSIPTTPGTLTNMSVAWQTTFFDFHQKNADFTQIDLAKAAMGAAASAPAAAAAASA